MSSAAPTLKYYDVQEPVEIHCDVSSKGLGAVLIQGGQPIAYTTRALTSAETRYAQIEKEMLSIVHACYKFHQYVYGKPSIQGFNNHKPLEAIFRKLLTQTPLRLQRMRLSLQWYNIDVQYRKGKEMTMLDTLSRAFLDIKEMQEGRAPISMLHYVTVSEQKYAKLQAIQAVRVGQLGTDHTQGMA